MGRRRAALLGMALGVAGCATDSDATGPVNGPRGDVQGMAALHIRSESRDAASTLRLRMPDGETFTGRTAPQDDPGPPPTTPFAAWLPAARTVDSLTTGNQLATLRGDRGTVMACSFTTARGPLASGGIGHCRVSDGRIVTFKF